MKNSKRSGAKPINHDKKMRLALASRPRRGHGIIPRLRGVEPQPRPQVEGSPLDEKFQTFQRKNLPKYPINHAIINP